LKEENNALFINGGWGHKGPNPWLAREKEYP